MQTVDSLISGNTAAVGGGLSLSAQRFKYFPAAVTSSVVRTTVEGNRATNRSGGGIDVRDFAFGDLRVVDSTLRGNTAVVPAGSQEQSFGGGLAASGPLQSTVRLLGSTVSGNGADLGGGVAVGGPNQTALVGESGGVELDNSTIAANTAAAAGGGVYLSAGTLDGGGSSFLPLSRAAAPRVVTRATPQTQPITSTIVAGNTANGAAEDLHRATEIDEDTGQPEEDSEINEGRFDLSYALVQAPGSAPITRTPGTGSQVGVDPRLGALADNGGPTRTHLPALGSPATDQGKAPARLLADQRGLPRIVDGDPDDAAGGDGADVGAVERQEGRTPPPPPQTSPGTGGADDAPPTVALQSPPRDAILPGSRTAELRATAADDRGVARVLFMVGERVVCTDTTAPYACRYRPVGGDVGRTTIAAIAVDGAGQTAADLRTVRFGRFVPRRVTISATAKRLSRRSVRVSTSGRVLLPPQVTRARGCGGRVAVSVKAGKKTISTRRVNLTTRCTYRSRVTFRVPSRLRPQPLRIVASFSGNSTLTARRSSFVRRTPR